jgi:chromate transporter
VRGWGRYNQRMTQSTESDPAAAKATPPSLTAILVAFLRLGCTSFGGGTAAWLHREFVLRRRWLDDRTFLAAFALNQTLPGSNGVKQAVLIGQHLRGMPGAAVALFGLLAGPFVIVLGVAAIYAGVVQHKIVHDMLDGVAAAVIGLTFATGLRSGVYGAPGPVPWVIVAVTVLCIGVLDWPLIPVVLCLIPVSVGLAWAQGRRR